MTTWSGVVYVAFVVDVYSRAIVGWNASTNKRTPLVLGALDMGLWRRDRAGRAVARSLLPGPNFHRQATTSLRTAGSATHGFTSRSAGRTNRSSRAGLLR